MGSEYSPQELKRLNLTQLMEHGRQALETGAYEQATSLFREAVRRAPMRQDVKDALGMAIEGQLLSGRAPRRPEPPPRPQPRPAAPERPSPPPPRRETPPPNHGPEVRAPWPERENPRERPEPAWQPRPAAPTPPPNAWPTQPPKPRFNAPPEDWTEQYPPQTRPAAPPEPWVEPLRPEPRYEARPEPRPHESRFDETGRRDLPQPRPAREAARSEPPQGGRYPKPQQQGQGQARAAHQPPPPAHSRPLDFHRRHQRGPISAYLFGAFFGLLVSALVGGIAWFYFQYPEMLGKFQKNGPSVAELDSAAERARLHTQKGEFAKAYAALAAFPESPERNARLASLHGYEGDQFLFMSNPPSHGRAIKAYQAAIGLDPANPQYRNRLAEAYYQLALTQNADHTAAEANLDLARQTCEAALAKQADSVDALDILSRVAVQKRDDLLLAKTLQRLIDVAPESDKAAKARQTLSDLKLTAPPSTKAQ